MLSDKFYPTPLAELLQLILNQIDMHDQLFGIPSGLFFRPQPSDPFRSTRYGKLLETPLGVAAGPHTQLSQNIVAAWLTGSRFIELKTIQTLDELEVPKPCIDMQDEGYNCEWSQELKIGQSFDQYLDAWILIHILQDKLGLEKGTGPGPGTIFNMSVGYNLEGIMKDNVQWFLNKMGDASQELQHKIQSIKEIYPRVIHLDISPVISDNVTLSTMHGCPSGEIEKIAAYLLKERKLHTAVKFNPTLLGKETLHDIMKQSGFQTVVPDQAFEHDLKYPEALQIIKNMQQLAAENQRVFSLKLTNTLESLNHKEVFTPETEMMYNSGRSLHPVSVGVASKLQETFDGTLDISFSGGAHAFNIADLIACGLSPVTVCSDLLKPGGYSRTHQYIETLHEAFNVQKAGSIDEFIMGENPGHYPLAQCIQRNLLGYAVKTLRNPLYKKKDLREPNIKTRRPLGTFDCIHAPCIDTCPASQDIPAYNYHTSQGDFQGAAEIILQTNPFPRVTGMICDHLCQLKCTRINYDQAVGIREIKRFIAESGIKEKHPKIPLHGKTVAIIGAGPSGLSAARFLAQAGFKTAIYESKARAGGMISGVIPPFRLTDEAMENDLQGIEALGVRLHFNNPMNRTTFAQLRNEYDYIYIAAGAQKASILNLENNDAIGVVNPLQLLEAVKLGQHPDIGTRVAIIGGGNTAMDAARTARRLAGANGKVIVIYRRTIREMPADMGEIKAVMEEGIEIMELTAPLKIITESGRVKSITCCKMKLGEKDQSGRPRPVMVPDSAFELMVDTLIPAVGQDTDFDLDESNALKAKPGSYETSLPGIFIGGDALRGASTAINAIGDGRKVAQEIIDREGIPFNTLVVNNRQQAPFSWHMKKRARREEAVVLQETPVSERMNFEMVTSTLIAQEAVKEAQRCLLCDEVCSICSTVCPNLAFYTYPTEPAAYLLQKLVRNGESHEVVADKEFRINQNHQILHIADWCNRCGNCNTFCPSADAPYLVKPHLFLNEKAFRAGEEGYWLENKNGMEIFHQRSPEGRFRLIELEDHLVYEGETFSIWLTKDTLEITGFELMDDIDDEVKLSNAARMYFILKGAHSFLGIDPANSDNFLKKQ